jgi:electron transfer flavoprotein alpha/beta subunit
VVCGEESSDGATAQVPPGIAEWLGFAQVTYATEVALVDGETRLWARRSLPGGYEVLLTGLPAVISVQARSTWPRFLDMERRPWASGAPVTVWAADDLPLDPEAIGAAGSPTAVAGTREAEQRERRREMLAGTPAEQVRALVERLRSTVVAHPGARPDPANGRAAEQQPMPASTVATGAPAAVSPATTAQRLPRSARAVSQGRALPG